MTRTVPRIVLPLTLLTAAFALALPAQATLTRTFYTYQDNRINLNSVDTTGTALNTVFAAQ